MFDLKKFTALAAIGAFTFGAAATTYAAVPQQKEPPRAEQPAPQLNQDQKDKLGAKDDIIQIDQMGDYEGTDQKDIKDAKSAKDVKDVEVKDIKDAKDVKAAKGSKAITEAKDVKGQPAEAVKVIPAAPEQDQKASNLRKDADHKVIPQDDHKNAPQPKK